LVSLQKPAPRILNVVALGHRERYGTVDRLAHVLQVLAGGISHGHEERAVGAQPNPDRRTPLSNFRVQERRSTEIDRNVEDVEVLDAELSGESTCDVLRKQPATLDEDLTKPTPGSNLLGQREIELLGAEQLALEQHGAQSRPRVIA